MSPGPSSRGDPPENPEGTQLKSSGGLSALSSNEVNFLVYRYLLESGFGHAAFTFGCESDVDRIDIQGKDVPVGALVSFIQKGFQMMEIEANLNASGSDVYGKYVQFSANDILTKDLDELRQIAKNMQSDLGESLEDQGVKKTKKKRANGKEGSSNNPMNKEDTKMDDRIGGSVLPPLEVHVSDVVGKQQIGDDGMDLDSPEDALHEHTIVETKQEDDTKVFDSDKEQRNLANGDIGGLDPSSPGIAAKIEEPLPPSPPPITD